MKVLITGGAGYIGSITARALERAGHIPLILDSLVSGPRAFVGDRLFYPGDVSDRHLVARIVRDHPDLECTIYMAARIVVPESRAHPYVYYRENVAKALEFFDELVTSGKPNIVFSSSASVYAPTENFEVWEHSPVAPSSPYGRTKHVVEMVLQDMAAASDLRAIILRYFNPIGADPELTAGSHVQEPTHVLGQLTLAALGRQNFFTLTGANFATRDGTGVRDYIHVWDLAQAHVAAVERFEQVLAHDGASSSVINVGSGHSVTVRELIHEFEAVIGKAVPVREAQPRPGDAVGAFANVEKARELLGWSAIHDLREGIESSLAWAKKRKVVLGYD